MLLVRVSLLIVFLIWLDFGVWGVFTATAITGGLFGVGLTFRELTISTFRPDFSKIKDIARFVLPFVPTGLCFFVLQKMGTRFFLIHNGNQTQVGIYALAYRLVLALGTFSLVAFKRVWTARMFDDYSDPNATKIVGHAVRGQLSVYLFASVWVLSFKGIQLLPFSPLLNT